jgi:hypothetical protein
LVEQERKKASDENIQDGERASEGGRPNNPYGWLVRSDGRLTARDVRMGGDVELQDVADDKRKGFKSLIYPRWFSQQGAEGLRFWEVLSNRKPITRMASLIMGLLKMRIAEG